MSIDFDNLSVFQKTQLNHIVDEHKQREQRVKPIIQQLKNYMVLNIWELDSFQIAKIKRSDKKEIMYATFLNYQSLKQFASTLDHALLVCLAHKYEGHHSSFPGYAERMLGANFMPEEEES